MFFSIHKTSVWKQMFIDLILHYTLLLYAKTFHSNCCEFHTHIQANNAHSQNTVLCFFIYIHTLINNISRVRNMTDGMKKMTQSFTAVWNRTLQTQTCFPHFWFKDSSFEAEDVLMDSHRFWCWGSEILPNTRPVPAQIKETQIYTKCLIL